ncbi:MAG: hypothetical protein AB8B55_13475 [Mariniblastus sp.]
MAPWFLNEERLHHCLVQTAIFFTFQSEGICLLKSHQDRGFSDDFSSFLSEIENEEPRFQKLSSKSFNVAIALETGFLGVGAAGASYGAFLILITSFFGGFTSWPTLAIGIGIASILGLTLAMLAGLFSALLLFLFCYSFGFALDLRVTTCFFGGLSGYLSSFSFMVADWSLGNLILIFLFVGGAMLFGQIGALTFASKYSTYYKNQGKNSTTQFQFQVRHLFIATVWVSVLLAIDQLSLSHMVLLLAINYAVIQTILIAGDQVFIRLTKFDPQPNSTGTHPNLEDNCRI